MSEYMELGQTFTEALNSANQAHREGGMDFQTYENYASAPGSVDSVLGSASGVPNLALDSTYGSASHLVPSGPVSGAISAASGPVAGTNHIPVSVPFSVNTSAPIEAPVSVPVSVNVSAPISATVSAPASGTVSGIISSPVTGRPSAFKYHCESCNKYFSRKSQLKQHLTASTAHPELYIQCRCGKRFSQYSLTQHFHKKLKPCNTIIDFRCHCGKIVRSNTPGAEKEILDHGYACARQT
ncbi:hypothetical protein V8C42DRAFT_342571 [Trichoderma barbatum]